MIKMEVFQRPQLAKVMYKTLTELAEFNLIKLRKRKLDLKNFNYSNIFQIAKVMFQYAHKVFLEDTEEE